MFNALYINSKFKAFVYRNLNDKCWSVKALSGLHAGKVVLHAASVCVHKPVFKVSEAGRQRVLKEKRKNVHAGVVGEVFMATVITERYDTMPSTNAPIDNVDEQLLEHFVDHPAYREVTYNPYKFDRFVFADSLETAVVEDVSDESVALAPDMKVYVESIRKLLEVVSKRRA